MRQLPIKVGTVVVYTRQTLYSEDGTVWRPQAAPRRAQVTGYDLFHSKYRLGVEYAPGLFSESGTWAFEKEVEVEA